MKLGRVLFGVICLCLAAVLPACGEDPVQEDILTYMDELEPLITLEEQIVYEFESVTGVNSVDDWTTYIHIEDVVIPLYLDFIDRLEEITPATREVRDIHEIYIEGSNLQYNAFLKILSAIEYGSYDMIGESNQMLAEARALMRNYVSEFGHLADEHGVEFE
ncbi:hypothetical protein [Evansella tamaricis]|uniref:Uncharacterized protein n=1 Tax=Evansella tamaricis TaxID=2069301 RepID=A0ABS6JGC4_9BACI|nr:hypothetical protein [Evansella tamaricis]MBU9712692.1 hypothetical protein [Evansella tamaricis]